MECKICKKENTKAFSAKIMGRYTIDYFHCSHCGFLQTETPYWLEEAYQKAINFSDVGYLQRNRLYSDKLSVILYFLFKGNGKFLDFAGGYGVFVRMMRDKGFDFYWEDKFCENLFAKGFEKELTEFFEAITLFEVMEHLEDPMDQLKAFFRHTDYVIFSTELYPKNNPKPAEWWYFGLEHGQHISFYSEKTLNFIANQLGLQYQRLGSLHFLSKKKIPTWILRSTKGLRFGLDRYIEGKMISKTWSDFQKVLSSEEKILSSNQ